MKPKNHPGKKALRQARAKGDRINPDPKVSDTRVRLGAEKRAASGFVIPPAPDTKEERDIIRSLFCEICKRGGPRRRYLGIQRLNTSEYVALCANCCKRLGARGVAPQLVGDPVTLLGPCGSAKEIVRSLNERMLTGFLRSEEMKAEHERIRKLLESPAGQRVVEAGRKLCPDPNCLVHHPERQISEEKTYAEPAPGSYHMTVPPTPGDKE